VPDWPDPTNTGGEFEFYLRVVGIDPTSPQAMAAEQEGQSQLGLSKSQMHLPPSKPAARGGVRVGGGS
jgi:hypothetical protein